MDTFLDILTNHPRAIIGTVNTFVRWNGEDECFEFWKEGTPQWIMTFAPDTDPHDIEQDLAIKLWQVIG